MEDLAEPIDDLICVFDGPGSATMDTLALLAFGWLLAALFVLWLGRAIYGWVMARRTAKAKAAGQEKIPVVEGPAATSTIKPQKLAATPSAPTRRRITRQSPGPEARRAPPPVPKCTGPETVSVAWVNDLLRWLYSDLVVVHELLAEWVHNLNTFTTQSATEDGIGVEFIRVLPETHAPVISNVFAECDSKDDVTITCDLEAMPAFQMKSSRQCSEKLETSHYRVNVNRFRARLCALFVTERMKMQLKCDGWPEIKVAIAPVGNIKNNLDETHLQDLLSEIVINALRNTDVEINFSQYLTCPRLVRPTNNALSNKFSTQVNGMHLSTPNSSNQAVYSDKRLLVKVVKAEQLGSVAGCYEPFCIVELDDPPQKNQTSVKKDTSSPFWDEHFLFEVSPATAEIMFEVYDRASQPHRFLGLGLVGMDELVVNPSQRQVIALQSKPYEADPLVTGTLTVEFLFIEGMDMPELNERPYKLKQTLRTVSPSGALITTTKTTFAQNENLSNGINPTDSALKELESRQGPGNANKSTLIIHSVQRQPSQRLVKVQLTDGTWKEVTPPPETDQPSEIETGYLGRDKHGVDDSTGASVDPAEPRGRPRKRRDFFGTIKRRLARSRTRSRSAGPPDEEYDNDPSMLRSISADRSRGVNGGRLSVPGQNMDENSRRSSLSEASGLSGASTRTYVNEASTLVLETVENDIKKHYLVPLSLAQKSKWRKKGTKLHIYNDHTFIAKHIPGGTICPVCGKSIPRRLGKQAYECRDCLLKCHKQCHVKVPNTCPSSTIHNIELNYITNPYTDKNIRML